MGIAEKLSQMGIVLPQAAPPAANYLPWRRHGELLLISGQLPMKEGKLALTGKLGAGLDVAAGQEAARLCAINVLAQAKAGLDGDLERLGALLRITGYVASAPGFSEQHLVINGASDLFAEVLGKRGAHSRAAVGVASLPLDAAVEVDAIIALA
ncbi:RidA family protein [Afifella pfennigii]|uniref:RidA family protein n=1 Tax=Afifella pfennigii TaxID=209897 RepID=UPI00047945B7|nr:RidA family protein [Afifella pfennigii]